MLFAWTSLCLREQLTGTQLLGRNEATTADHKHRVFRVAADTASFW